MSGFSIGDRVEVVDNGSVAWDDFVRPGMRGVVSSVLQVSPSIRGNCWAQAHLVTLSCGRNAWIAYPLLRKLDELRDDLAVVRWTECYWQPPYVVAS